MIRIPLLLPNLCVALAFAAATGVARADELAEIQRLQAAGQTAPALQLGRPVVLFTLSDTQLNDVTRDGSRGLAWVARAGTPTTLVTVTDWFDELRAKAPASR